jgi:hypothetical protein
MDLSVIYVAGLFDGEGSIGLYEGKQGGWNFRVQLVQNESPEALLLWSNMRDRWGGHVSHARSANGRAKMNWQIGQDSAAQFLRDIRPWLILKAEQVDVALGWLAARPTIRRDPATGRTLPRSAEDVAATRVAAAMLKQLKRGDIDVVMADAADLVTVDHTLRQIVNVKGD